MVDHLLYCLIRPICGSVVHINCLQIQQKTWLKWSVKPNHIPSNLLKLDTIFLFRRLFCWCFASVSVFVRWISVLKQIISRSGSSFIVDGLLSFFFWVIYWIVVSHILRLWWNRTISYWSLRFFFILSFVVVWILRFSSIYRRFWIGLSSSMIRLVILKLDSKLFLNFFNLFRRFY